LAAEEIHRRILAHDIELNEGMLVENVVSQMLVAAGHQLYFYSRRAHDEAKKRKRMEIDFLVSRSKVAHRNNIRPLEVKSGKNATHRSLDKFVGKFPDYVYEPTILWAKDRKEKDGVSYLPIYMTPCLVELF